MADNPFTSAYSPLLYMQDQSANRLGWNALGNVYLQYTPMKGLTLKTTFSPTFSYNRYGFYQGTEVGETENNATRTTSQGYSWTWDNIVTWDRTLADIHHLNLMGLVSATYSNGESENLYYKNVMEGTCCRRMAHQRRGLREAEPAMGVEPEAAPLLRCDG